MEEQSSETKLRLEMNHYRDLIKFCTGVKAIEVLNDLIGEAQEQLDVFKNSELS